MKKIILALVLLASVPAFMVAQPGGAKGPAPSSMASDKMSDGWEVTINKMKTEDRNRITETAAQIQSQSGATRSVLTDILKAGGFGAVSTTIDVVTNEIIHLAKFRKEQKEKWWKMITNECNYTDSLVSIKGLNDFYTDKSAYSALDPSSINFNGISVRGVRDGREVLYLSCSVDQTRMDHIFNHSKFYLVIDTISFHPYECHLPNLSANGIFLRSNEESERDNSFLFNERNNLSVGMELTLTSSWINEAVMVMKDVPLGTFKLTVNIPDNTREYTYSRKQIEANRELMKKDASLKLDTSFVQMEGDCFVVPRSYMPTRDNKRMWGTGEYKLKVKFREACQFSKDATQNEKMKHWKKDYKQLRKMQKQGSEFTEYFRTLWKDNGETLMKTMIKQGITTGASAAGLSQSSGGGMSGGGSMSGASAGGSSQGGGGAMPGGNAHP